MIILKKYYKAGYISMNFDLVPIIDLNYRGVERSLTGLEFASIDNSKEFEHILNLYYNYCDWSFNGQNSLCDLRNYIFPLYFEMLKNNINCEIIAFDEKPIDGFDNVQFEFLGFDILNQNMESYILDTDLKIIKDNLNEMGLLNNLDITNYIIQDILSTIDKNHFLKSYYIYHIVNMQCTGDGSLC